MPRGGAKVTTRRRRKAEEAREEILDAAERRLRESGPAGVRLQEVAADVGVSHPAVLHHFGSREGLVAAVIDRAMKHLEEDLMKALAEEASAPGRLGATDLLDPIASVIRDAGYARLIAWLLLSGYEPLADEGTRTRWMQIGDAMHAMRIQQSKAKKKPALEDTRFVMVLASLTMFGEAIAGKGALNAAGFGDDALAAKRFRKWFAVLLERHMEEGAP